MLSARDGKSVTDTMREFMTTKTCSLLFRPQSFLYLESPEYIMDMLEAEYSCDFERFVEV